MPAAAGRPRYAMPACWARQHPPSLMMVDVAAPNTPALRTEVVRRRLAFEANPDGFIAQWQPQTDTLRQQVQAARNRLDSVNLPDSLLEWISELCCRLSAMSLRA